jgi:hypothetical protein
LSSNDRLGPQQSAADCFRKVIDFDEVFVKLVDKRDRTAR